MLQFYFKQCLLFVTFLFILCLFSSTAIAETVDEILETQKELKRESEFRKKQLKAQQDSIRETKDAISMGYKEFEQSCSLCHGVDGKGNGVYTYALKDKPADLTQIKNRNNGIFPFTKMYHIIDGRNENIFHGTRDMPIWGDRFSSENWIVTSPRNSETLVRGRIFELLLYLESIQD